MLGVGASRAFVTSEDPKQVLTEMSKALLK